MEDQERYVLSFLPFSTPVVYDANNQIVYQQHLPDGVKLRGDINVLLLGDPSTAKSQVSSVIFIYWHNFSALPLSLVEKLLHLAWFHIPRLVKQSYRFLVLFFRPK